MAATAFVLHYSYGVTPPEVPGGVNVWNWWGGRKWAPQRDRMIAKGAEVLKYVLPVHDYPYSTGEPEIGLWYTGKAQGCGAHPAPREWYWDPANPSRVVVGNYGGYVMDLRKGSKFVEHIFADVVPLAQAGALGWRDSGWLLDVTGDGYWGQISGLNLSERPEYSAGIRDFVRRLRAALPRHIFIGNNAWDVSKGPIDLHGLMIENHNGTEVGADHWMDQIAIFQPTDGRKRCVTINRNQPDAVAWSKVPGIAAAGFDPRIGGDYQVGATIPGITAYPLSNAVWPYSGSTPPPPPPPPPPPATPLPTAPTAVRAVPAPTGPGHILVSWDANPISEGVKTYQVYLGGNLIADGITATSYTAKDLDPTKSYAVQVSARNDLSVEGEGYGPWNLPAVNCTPSQPAPPPTGTVMYPKDVVDALLADLEQRDKAIAGRITTITGTGPNRWTNLSPSQKTSLNQLRDRASGGVTAIAAFRAANPGTTVTSVGVNV
jgi:hypothetical protein